MRIAKAECISSELYFRQYLLFHFSVSVFPDGQHTVPTVRQFMSQRKPELLDSLRYVNLIILHQLQSTNSGWCQGAGLCVSECFGMCFDKGIVISIAKIFC